LSVNGTGLRRRGRGRGRPSSGEGPVLRGEHVSRTYGSAASEVHALSDVSVELHAGELVMLRGPSGSGKTTLLNILGGLDGPTSGRVWLGDTELTATRESDLVELRRRELGFVFQSFALLPMLTAAENIEVPLRLVGTPVKERAARVDELLESVGLSRHAAQRPDQLSGGQRQRVGIARAIANRPAVLIADEPTGQLDSRTAAVMMDLIASLVHEHSLAAIVTTHDPRLLVRADRLLQITDGRLAEAASTSTA
jgi:putative ABC transport system ATP-binding protein